MNKLLTPSYWWSITTTNTWYTWYIRVSLFIIYFWFGILKVLDLSPANPLVAQLQAKTVPFMSFELFILLFGLFEMAVGIAWLYPRLTRIMAVITGLHLVTTAATIVFTPTVIWQSWFVPTLEGQYVIKNLLIVAVMIGLWQTTSLRLHKQSNKTLM